MLPSWNFSFTFGSLLILHVELSMTVDDVKGKINGGENKNLKKHFVFIEYVVPESHVEVDMWDSTR